MNKRKITCFILGVMLAVGGAYGYLKSRGASDRDHPSSWQAYCSKDRRFAIAFPQDPQESDEEMRIAGKRIQFHQLSSEGQRASYAVSYVDFPSHWKWLGSKKLLVKSFEMLMENEPNVQTIVHQELTYHSGDPALLYQVQQEGKESVGKFVISGNTLFRVAVTYPLSGSESVEPQGFIDSFEIRRA